MAAMLVAASLQTHAQGLVYDQQSANSPVLLLNNNSADGLNIQSHSLTQAFIPTLSAIRFVQFEFWDIPNNGTNGATVSVNLWTGSPNINSATLLGSTAPLYMPNGFVNDGLDFAGVGTFFFSMLISLIPGQTYYLQPVVLSGDNPWDIIALNFNTYLGGGLYFGGVQSEDTNLWFREGIVSVPEPSTFVLIAISSLLMFGFKLRSKLFVLILACMLFSIAVLSVHATGDSVVQATLGEAGLTLVDAAALPDNGTFWVMTVDSDGELIESPYPALPPDLLTLPIYSVTNDIYMVDDSGGQLAPASAGRLSSAQATSIARTQALTMASLIDEIQLDGSDGTNQPFELDYALRVYGSNDLWLSIYSVTNGISHIIIHPPWNVNVSTSSWNLFYTTNISTPFSNWWWILTTDLGQTNLIVPNATDAHGFYALGLVNTNGRPEAGGDTEPPLCPNTSRSIVLQPVNSSYTYTILTHPTNGVLSGTAPYLTYTPNPCFQNGQDSFVFKLNDGTNDSAPTTVSFFIEPDNLYANAVSFQACRVTPANFTLDGGNCSGTPSYELLTLPAHGILSGTLPNLTYTPTNSAFTGTDSFNYAAYDSCGIATNGVTITVGDMSLYPNSQTAMVGTNQSTAIPLIMSDYGDACTDDPSYYTYTITSSPTNGTLSGAGANPVYTPNLNYEGVDSFQYTANDGVWPANPSAPYILYVVAGPTLFSECDPFSTAVALDWSLDSKVQQMINQNGLYISDYIIYRATNSGGSYTAIATNYGVNQTSYLDGTAASGLTNYYVVTFQNHDSGIGLTNESPRSNPIAVKGGQNPNNLISANAFWDTVTNYPNQNNVTRLQAPFSSEYPGQYETLYPLPNSYWPVGTTWSNHIALYIPTNSLNLSLVQYSIAIDNEYKLYLNNSTNYIDMTNHDGPAVWSSFKSFNSVSPGNLHYGTNNIGIVIKDDGLKNYFSMVVTTNTCGQ